MADNSHDSTEAGGLTSFVNPYYYIVGAGETTDELQATGEWIATDSPMEVLR